MTKRLSERYDSDETEEEEDMEERELKRSSAKGWNDRRGTGMPAAKRQKLARSHDEAILVAFREQDEKMGEMYKETVSNSIDRLVQAISSPAPATVFSQDEMRHLSQEQGELKSQIAEQGETIRKLGETMESNNNQVMALLRQVLDKA